MHVEITNALFKLVPDCVDVGIALVVVFGAVVVLEVGVLLVVVLDVVLSVVIDEVLGVVTGFVSCTVVPSWTSVDVSGLIVLCITSVDSTMYFDVFRVSEFDL